MNKAELIELAAAPCHECKLPVLRIETCWILDDDRCWHLGPSYMVCGQGHRILVELFDAKGD